MAVYNTGQAGRALRESPRRKRTLVRRRGEKFRPLFDLLHCSRIDFGPRTTMFPRKRFDP
jgi:hypothetical protein